jgi:iron complex outermembrane receptor protein
MSSQQTARRTRSRFKRAMVAEVLQSAFVPAAIVTAFAVAPAVAHGQSGVAPEPAEQTLGQIVVGADPDRSYRTERTQIGTFRDQSIVEVPLTVNVVPRQVIEAQHATTLYEALKNTAGVTRSQLGPTVYSNIAIRGITVENRGNYRLNGGLPVVNLIDLPLENKERVEVLKGSAGLYYGLIPPSGLVNLVTKRATSRPVSDVTLSGNQHGGYGAAADLGRQNSDGTFGWRVNAAASHVGEGISGIEGERQFASVALDFKPTRDWSLKFDAEVIHQDTVEQASLRVPNPVEGVITLPRLPDPTRLLTGPWARYIADARNIVLRSDYAVSDRWILTVEAGRASTERPTRYFTQIENYDVVSGEGNARTFVQCCQDYTNTYGRIEALGTFETGPLGHDLTLGYAANKREQTSGATAQVTQAQNIYEPRPLPQPGPSLPTPIGRGQIDDKGLYVFDRITYGENWLATVGARRIDYSNVSPNARYDTQETTPAASLAYRFNRDSNVYASYIEGFEEGGQAPLNAANALQSLPALKARQVEIGAKKQFGNGTLVQASLFEIRRPSAGTNLATNVYEVIGDARYRGLELSANGDLTRQLSLYASMQFLNAEITRAADPALVGKTPDNTPRYTFSVWSEYKLATYPGLSLGAGAFYIGKRAVDALNQAYIDGFVRVDAGVNYATNIAGRPVLLRALLENAFDENYWAAAGNNLLAQGLPRTLRLSARVSF